MKRVTFLRHGATGSLVSKADEKITSDAKEGLKEFGEMLNRNLKGAEIVLAFGDLVRHQESADAFMNAYGRNKVYQMKTEDLNEKNYGHLYDTHDEETRRKLADATWNSDYEERLVGAYGCETNKSVFERLSAVWEDLQTMDPQLDDVVIISSGGALAMMQFIVEGKTLNEIESMPEYEKRRKVMRHGEMRTMEVTLQPAVPSI